MLRGAGRRVPHVLMVAVVGVMVAACAPAPSSGGGGGGGMVQFDPLVTDAASKSSPLAPSFAYPPTGSPRGELALLFNGTGAGPTALSRMGGKLAAEGFHVIGLRYESNVGTLEACPDTQQAANPDCHRQFRGEVVYGANLPDPLGATFNHPSIDVTAPNSVMSRLVKHVEYLRERYPTQGWDYYQERGADGHCAQPMRGACAPRWDRIVPVGHSQGAGVALYLAKHHPVARLAMLSGPYDAFRDGDGGFVIAPWIAEGGFQLNSLDMRTFSHVGDPAIGYHRAATEALNIPGIEVMATLFPRPYGGARRLVTNAPPVCPFDTAQTHNSTATDLCAPAANEAPWRYLATGQ